MANDEHYQTLLAAISSSDWSKWDQWRKDNPNLAPDLKGADLHSEDLHLADLSAADLRRANLSNAVLAGARLSGTQLTDAILHGADLSHADLRYAQLQRADLTRANLTGADLRFAELRGTNFTNARLSNAAVDPSALRRAINAKLDVTETKGVRWKPARPEELIPSVSLYKRLRDLITAGRSRLSRLAPGLFEHEELVTLGLSQRAKLKDKQPAERDIESKPRGKSDESRK
jgi:hypothetical protein